MFGLGILTYVKIGAAVLLMAVAGYFIYEFRHRGTQITELRQQVAELNLKAEVIEKAQKATESYNQAQKEVAKKNVKEKADVDTMVESGDDTGLSDLYIKHGLLNPSKGGASKSGT